MKSLYSTFYIDVCPPPISYACGKYVCFCGRGGMLLSDGNLTLALKDCGAESGYIRSASLNILLVDTARQTAAWVCLK